MRRLLIFLMWICPLLVAAQDEASIRYISDEISVTLRKGEGMNSEVASLVKSGTRVELIETGGEGYARVRISPGREGWVLSKYLSTEPPARERVATLAARLAEKQAQVRKLEARIGRLEKQLGGAPEAEEAAAASGSPEAAEKPVVQTLTALGMVVAGVLLGLIISVLLGGRKRKKWSPEL